MSTEFLDRLATQLKANKNSACRRAIQGILALVKTNCEYGQYSSQAEAENGFRKLVERDHTWNESQLRDQYRLAA
jgi:hypothetical protein